MLPLIRASLTHYVAHTGVLIAEVKLDESGDHYEWQYERTAIRDTNHDHESTQFKVLQTSQNTQEIHYPIPISDDSSAELIVEISVKAEDYHLLIDGFSKIYKNYLIVLHESERDKLTGLLNRRTLEERLSRSFDLISGQDDGLNMWVAIIDLDHFKTINDNFGHMIGDEVLLMFAQQMQNYFSDNEQLFRFGGEEFVVLLPQQDNKDVINKLEGFRKHIERYRFPQIRQLTLSCGICAISPNEYLPTILGHADKALYLAKEQGRNQVRCYEECLNELNDSNGLDPYDEVELF
tara:strand:- start:1475 stop:2353 length:879 start_codon:yes stop_codon:yes gene_type:complete